MAEYSQHSDSVESLRVRDLLRNRELTVPKIVGARLCQRLGKRAWQRPNVAISGRLYRKYGVEDPWDPNSDNKGRELGLGPVGLRLTEPRRQVAPHLKPKEPRSKKKTQAVDPLARWRKKPNARPRGENKPPSEPTPAMPPDTPSGHRIRGKLPVRPDLAEVVAAKGGPSSKSPAPVESLAKSISSSSTASVKAQKSRRGGARVRMRGRHVQSPAPQVIGESSEHPPPTRPSSPSVLANSTQEAPRNVSRSVPKGGLGMDDLFGSAAEAGRLRVRPRRSESKEEGDK